MTEQNFPLYEEAVSILKGCHLSGSLQVALPYPECETGSGQTALPEMVAILFRGRYVLLYRLAQSDSPWDNRIAMMATYTFIHNGNVEDTFRLALSLMESPHPLVQKAVGWMLHEAGKYDLFRLSLFIDKYRQEMSRAMLRIAASGFPKEKRRECFRRC